MTLKLKIQNLIEEVGSRVSATDFKIEDFPPLATELLSTFDWNFNHLEFQDYLKSLGSLPRQSFTRDEFGELPFTLFRHDKFHLDVYVWNNNETSIHDHHFCGAFKLLTGKSLQMTYHFEEGRNVSPLVNVGTLTKISTRYLNQGDVQEIQLGEKFIHQVIHLDFPTVTFILRTPDLMDNLLSYWSSGLRLKFNLDHPKMTKILDFFDSVLIFHQDDQDQSFLDRLIYPILDQFTVVEMAACLQRMRLFVSEPVHTMMKDYALKSPLAADYELMLNSVKNEQKMIYKLLFLKHVTRA